MNIFLCDPDVNKCAQALDNLRLNKMLIETGQLLSTAYRRLIPDRDAYPESLYKSTHENHPCSVWVRESLDNYLWLLTYFNALHEEYYYRKRSNHMTWVKLNKVLKDPVEGMEFKPIQELKVSFDCSSVFDDKISIYDKYRTCLRNKWKHDSSTPSWGSRQPPEWSGV